MNSPRLPTISLTLPGSGVLWSLGIILLADALALAVLASPLSRFPNVDFFAYTWLELAFAPMSLAANLAGAALAAAIICLSFRKQPARLANKARFDRALVFIHIAVLAHAAAVSLTLLTALDGGLMPPEIIWTALAGAALVLAIPNGMIWNIRYAALGAASSVIAFGCAVIYAPTIYGRDLQPLGWYAIMASAIPVLAFLSIFLRRAPIFSQSHWRRRGLAFALFAALAWAVGFQMASVSESAEFTESLRAAADSQPSQIRLSELTDFEWDAVELYSGGYLSAGDFSPAAREGVDIMDRTNVAVREGLHLAVFTKDGKAVYHEIFSWDGYYIQYPPSTNRMILKREEAVFNLGYSPYGTPRLTLSE